MNLIDKTYARFESGVGRAVDIVFDEIHNIKVPAVGREVRRIYNTPETLIRKSQSYQDLAKCQSPIIGRRDHNLYSFPLRRSHGVPLSAPPLPNVINITCTLLYNHLDDNHSLDPNNYVYLGCLNNNSFLHQGITLDEKGSLVLIKGKSKGLIKYLWQRIQGIEKFYCARIDLGKSYNLFFDKLSVNGCGQLIGKVQGKKECYIIQLDTSSRLHHYTVNAFCEASSSLDITLHQTLPAMKETNILHCTINKQHSIYLVLEAGKLYLKQRRTRPGVNRCQVTSSPLSLPLGSGARVTSVANLLNMVKIAVTIDEQKQVFYFSPRDIDTRRRKINLLTHKPPQGLYSGMANDPHEKVFSGQPFAGRRFGNFSSRHIPLLSMPIDNFRAKANTAKRHFHQGRRLRAMLSLAQGIDPGLRPLARTLTGLFNAGDVTPIRENIDNKWQEIREIGKFAQQKKLDKVATSASGYLNTRKHMANKLLYAIRLLNHNESIALSDIFDASFFFGIARAGIPFMPGWFSGMLCRLQKGATLTFSKLDNGNIKLTYDRIHEKSMIALIGSGQGLEDNCKIITVNHVDLGTVLPLEMNLILMLRLDLQRSFSFDFAARHLPLFLDSLFIPDAVDHTLDALANNVTFERSKEKNSQLLIEAKSELRAQVGFMANPSTFLVIPRCALGGCGALDFFTINKKSAISTVYEAGESADRITSFHLESYLKLSLEAYRETKIMPIAMVRAPLPLNNLFCIPLPLIEECNQTLPITRHPVLRHFRIDGATMKLHLSPLVPMEENDPQSSNKPSQLGGLGEEASHMDLFLASLAPLVPTDMLVLLNSIIFGLIDCNNNNHRYQLVKPGADISTFIVSKGDYQHHLLQLAQQSVPQVGPVAVPDRLTWILRVRRMLTPWTKHTTLGEFLAQQDTLLRGPDRPKGGTAYTAHDFIQALESYVARNSRQSIGKEAKINAVATYKIQPGVIKRVCEGVESILRDMLMDIKDGHDVECYRQPLLALAEVFDLANPQSNPFLQLDTIALVNEARLVRRVGTLPCTLLNISRTHGLSYSSHLETIKFDYRGRELFPYRISSSLKITPDLM